MVIGIYIQNGLMVITRGFACFYMYVVIVKGMKMWNWDSLTRKLDYVCMGICMGMFSGYVVEVGLILGSSIWEGNEENEMLKECKDELMKSLKWCIVEIGLLGVFGAIGWIGLRKVNDIGRRIWKMNEGSEVIELGWKGGKDEEEDGFNNNDSRMGLLESNKK